MVITNILIFDNMKCKEDFQEFERDMKEELSQYGKLENLLVPRPSHMIEGFGKKFEEPQID